MFFTGTLQEGIATSLQEGKSVVCFVTDGGEESQLWENEFLTDSSVNPKIINESIAMRLNAGSEEAGYLAAIFPLPKTPTLVIINNGELKGYIAAGTPKDDFVKRVLAAFRAVSQSTPGASQQSAAAEASQSQSQPQPEPQQQISSSSSSQGAHTPAAQEDDSTSGSSSNVQNLLAERRARLEAQRKDDERKAKEERAAKAAAAAADTSSEAVETRKRSEQLRKQRQDAADERARILQRIQADKMERLAAKDERMRQRQQERGEKSKENAGEPKLGDVAAALASAESSPMRPSSGQAALQVRLLDGSSLRSRFDATKASLKKEVRSWVDEKREDGSTQPYVFKVVLPPPQGSRKIDETEEGKTLGELGLAPSATLMLSPVQRFAEAYDSSGRPGGLLGMPFAAFGFIVGLFAWLWGLITGVFSGFGREENRETEGAEARADAERAANEAQAARVREQRRERFAQFNNADDRRRDQQLYNGNSLNFEPRPDEEEK